MKKALKNELGITLVALIVTIIILLILAGISIAQLTGNGLFEKAKLAKEKQANAQIEEDERLGDYENEIGKYLAGTRNTNYNNYSAEETEIGTWIDGKKLYRRVYSQTTANSIDISDLNYDYIQVSSRIYLKYNPNNHFYWRETYYDGSTNCFEDYIDNTEKKLLYLVGSNMTTQKIISIVEYTKNI